MNPELWQRAKEIYNSVLEKQPGQREAYIAEACAGDEVLRREVESMLGWEEKAGDFIESPALEVAGKAMAEQLIAEESADLTGRQLLHYMIREKIGAGGMGVVYKARDTHLDRFVAIKVLPPEKVAEPGRKRRFVQEAKAASALNHPSIITIYDIDRAEGVDFIAMEFVAGKTLEQLIPRKGMQLSLALKYAAQIADALARAHGAGIIHRDLKPSNVMVDEHGLVKVLDFGLAKLMEVSGPEAETVGTGEGTIVGTVVYMSPEQAEGRPIDTRSDIFSFGSMLYEMLTGQRAFRGDTRASTIASILREDPKPISQVAAGLPRDAEKIVRRCLRKDPEHRFQTMADLRVTLEELKEESDSGELETADVPRPKPGQMLIWALGAALLAIIVVALGWYLYRQKTDVTREPLQIVPFTDLPGTEESPKISPDGKLVAFQWNGPGKDNLDIYIKQVGRGEQPFRLTTDPADDMWPVWSPDGTEIAFVRVSGETATIYTVPSLGGVERRLYESRAALFGGGLSWSPDGRSLAFPEKSAVESPARVYLLPLDTRQKIPLTSPPPEIRGDFTPEFSPDGQRVAFVRVSSFATADLWIQPVSSGEATPLTHKNYEDISRPSWTADGREVVFAASHALFRVPFTGGVPQAIAGIGENVSDPAICGNHMVFTQYSSVQWRIWRMRGPNYKGKDRSPAPLMVSTRWDFCPDYSPDGKKLAFNSNRSGFSEIWTCGSDGSKPEQITYLRKLSDNPSWSPDGKRVAFGSTPAEYEEIFVIDADGGTPQRLTNEKSQGELPTWSRDGRWIYFASNRSGAYQVWKVPVGGGKSVQITREGGFCAVESFDGEMLYYTKPGRHRHDTGPIWKVPREGGKETSVMDREIYFLNWALRPEGLYFTTQNGKKYSIEFLSFQTGKIAPFYQEETPNEREFLTISPDGEWFVYTEGPPQESDLMLVENFR